MRASSRGGPAVNPQDADGQVDVLQGQQADLVRAQGMHPGQQHDQLLVGAVELAEQAGAASRVQPERHRWRLTSSDQAGGGVGEGQPRALRVLFDSFALR